MNEIINILIIIFAVAFVISQYQTAIGLLYWVWKGLETIYKGIIKLIRKFKK